MFAKSTYAVGFARPYQDIYEVENLTVREPRLARRFFDRFEPVHAVTYFSPESRAAFDALGFRGFWMGYFAGRSAPLGPVAA